jgi:hypothetical protein
MYSFHLCISCIWHGICNMMYMHPCIFNCMHFVSYALVRKSFSYIHCSPWNAIYVFVSLFGVIWLVLSGTALGVPFNNLEIPT